MTAPRWHAQTADEVFTRLETTRSGLDDEDVARRLARFGPNRLTPPKPTPATQILLDQLRSVVVILLIAATVVSLLLGDAVEAIAIAAVLIINTSIGFTTEFRARRAMEAILTLDVPRASVIRAGHLRAIDARNLVPGDIIEVIAGAQVPADARLITSTDLQTDEAALTGESLPASKAADRTLPGDTGLADRSNMIYSGTTTVAGVARAVVTATGRSTEVGRIGELMGSVQIERTPLERRLDELGHRLVWLALGVAALVAGLEALQGTPLDLIIETGIALAVAAVPEALPAVATIALAVGMRRMAARRALVRRLPAVESLGSTTVICTDKTRTLTSGDMALVRVWTPEAELSLSRHAPIGPVDANAMRVVEIATLASRPPAMHEEGQRAGAIDPVDRAIDEAARRLGVDRARLAHQHPEVGVVPFSSDRKLMASFRRHERGREIITHVKGAPSRVLGLCAMEPTRHVELIQVNNALAREGLRVLAVASGPVHEATEAALDGLTFVGFIGLADPPAPGVKGTIARLRAAGLRTIMLTGDQRLTAEAVGRELGLLRSGDRVVEGRELDAALADGLRVSAAMAAFSRITPEHKLRIVEALQQRGEIVAMLGDGVNDAPALKKADVGVAMGIRGTDVAKESSAIVLRDDRFDTIAAAVEEGRVIFDNIRKSVLYLFSCNVAEVLVLLVTGVIGLPLPLFPLQLLWLNMITDTFPALALALEPAEHDVMRRPPRNPDEAILSTGFLARVFTYGALITISTLAAFGFGLITAPERATTLAFMTLALAQIGHLGNVRSARAVLRPERAIANLYAVVAVAFSITLQIATVYVDPLPRLLRVTPPTALEWAIIGALSAVPAVIGQMVKLRRPHL